ncbi:hypothetical protein QEZ54_13940 [Catellatospora sp. KI3]|uniref:hypothetical protein n=1 Tax=Catellatospora sp. KI3 TaxID=3041620 RepID=UPI002482E125|nr:hypothetical protein [Catellatospora sp. KI3]MDI1462071.1 hypothetical protein [Catellatospora sp. KI3]
MQPQRPEAFGAGTDDEPDFASEHERTSTSDVVCAGADAHSDPDIPLGLGGMDLKRTRLLD